MTALRSSDEPLLPLDMKDHLGQSLDFRNQRQSTLNIRRQTRRGYKTIRLVRMGASARVKQSTVKCTIDGEERGRDREKFRSNEARGEAS